MKTILLIALFLILIAVSCDNPVDPNNNPPDEIENAIWPFHEGSFWEYDVWEIVSGEEYNYFEKYRVVDIFAHNEKRVAEIEFSKYTEDTVFAAFTFWWGNTTSGLYEYAPFDESFSAFDLPRLLFKYPAEDMDSFLTYSWDFANPFTMFYFDMGIPIVSVPAGDFEACVGYQLYYQTGHEPPIDNYYYFKPDTGYISYEKYEAGSPSKTRLLKDFLIS
ncbi:hypothetical protein KAH81_07205, partial [bacterium]|nr:hypothetical protein [bacterium]